MANADFNPKQTGTPGGFDAGSYREKASPEQAVQLTPLQQKLAGLEAKLPAALTRQAVALALSIVVMLAAFAGFGSAKVRSKYNTARQWFTVGVSADNGYNLSEELTARANTAANVITTAGNTLGADNAEVQTAQAALETGWKIRGIGNNIFGITKGSWTGPVSLELTTEYFKTPTVTFKAPERVVSVDQVAPDRYKYRVYRLFRVYPTVDACLDDHLALLKKPMYADAWPYRNDAKEYARRLVDNTGAKYATAPNYAAIMASVIDTVANIVKSL